MINGPGMTEREYQDYQDAMEKAADEARYEAERENEAHERAERDSLDSDD